ncbi:MAG TPA: calcium-binding protein, partial [Clostridia bacterium]
GNDYLEGGSGNDTYVFGIGYGKDWIYDNDNTAGNIDNISFLEGITASDVTLKRYNDSLIICLKGNADVLTVVDFYKSDCEKIEQINFNDGTSWNLDTILNLPTETITEEQAKEVYGDSAGYASIIKSNIDQRAAQKMADMLGFDYISWSSNSNLNSDIGNLISGIAIISGSETPYNNAAQAAPPRRIDPVILDLDGDGIETTNINSGTYFDLDANGFAEKSAWVKGDDGLLVLDRNNDGVIEGGSELFGDQTVLSNGNPAANGYQALLELDTNKDGKIDANDARFSELKIWKDSNEDGYSETNELFTLQDLGIKSLNLVYTNSNTLDSNGNTISRVSSFEKIDGTTAKMGEYLLQRNTGNTLALDRIDVPADIANLPDVQGAGNVYSLQQAMVRDESGELKTLVESFESEVSVAKRNDLLEQILYKWTGSDGLNPTSRGSNFDARKLAVLEKFMGRSYVGTGGSNPITEAVPQLMQAYNKLYEMIYSKLILQTHLKDIYSLVNYEWDDTANTMKADLTAVRDAIQTKIADNHEEGISTLNEFARVIKGYKIEDSVNFTQLRSYFASKGEEYGWAIDSAGKSVLQGSAGNDNIAGTAGDDAINGGANDDTLTGNVGNDALYGGDGSDSLSGGDGNDVLVGGAGDDKLNGGSGNDTYIFGLGDGVDTIYDSDTTAGNIDVLSFEEGITADKIAVKRNGRNLEISIKDTTDKVVIKDYFSPYYNNDYNYDSNNNVNKVEQIKFSDGTTWDVVKIKTMTTTEFEGTDGNDTIYGYNDGYSSPDETFKGNAGDDKIYGYDG